MAIEVVPMPVTRTFLGGCYGGYQVVIMLVVTTTSYKTPVQYFLYGHHGRGDKETEEDIVRGSEKEKKRA